MSVAIALAVMRRDTPSAAPDEELASVEQHGPRTLIVLDDVTTLDFDTVELHAATRSRVDHVRAA